MANPKAAVIKGVLLVQALPELIISYIELKEEPQSDLILEAIDPDRTIVQRLLFEHVRSSRNITLALSV